MGQAIVDPPDPQENSKPAPTNSADDLLSQLAGNEIDRLLAESEGQSPAAASSSPAAPPSSPLPAGESVGFDSAQSAAEIDALLSQAEQPPAQPQPQTPPAVSPADVLNEIEKKDAAAVAAPIAAKVNLSTQLLLNVPPPLPLVLKPLEWINAPLDAFPNRVREAIGKIAILTMMNAVAVLTYVLIFRRHH
jgi:hypothetical protein